ncbi:MAG: T9SS type A sorting domain-containing protein [Candidatus Eisenbacteria bacterium]|uniref:T9SS type A sorting domain-containing protein n=1 Tax=Eiseniibacteriota bacterium TaxID=2212470 RepID=A0A948RWY8_UNCEI|nr:T9SS type A sorting domain-containing protein [Candidatus Eisenbacteria bacterium]MBU1948239.1 T9SS type A sorting domain-containing protein [Candidatus Eisenbacteria bacterium]MBU2690567.1 T9SS type A sorting domain-containing protein [Candidatus Eisenbacteria bacterium]
MKRFNGFLFILCAFLLVSFIAAPGTARGDDSIYDIELGVYNVGDPVTVEGVIVTATGFWGINVQEPVADGTWGYKWSGIWVYTGNTHLGNVTRGDIVNVTGVYQEYYELSEIDITLGGGSITVVSSGNTLPAPVDVLISEVNDTGIDAEAYENVLIKVDRNDTSLFSRAPDTYDEWYLSTSATIGAGDSLLMEHISADPDGDFLYETPDSGTELAFSIGTLTYNHNQYKLAPRDCNDNGGICKPSLLSAYSTGPNSLGVQFSVDVEEASANDADNYELLSGLLITSAQRDPNNHKKVHLTTQTQTNAAPEQIIVNAVKSESGGLEMDPDQTYDFLAGITTIYAIQHIDPPYTIDASPLLGSVVTVQATVTAVDGTYYFLQEAPGGAWHNIYSRIAATGAGVRVGDVVQVAGEVREYYGLTQIGFRNGVNHFVNLGGSRDAVVITPVTASEIHYNAWTVGLNEPEPLESALVHLGPAIVDSSLVFDDAIYNEWFLIQEPDTAACHLAFLTGVTIYYTPCVGDEVEMTGVLSYDFSQYRVVPRNDDDITIISGCNIASVDELNGNKLWLSPARPNPFGQISSLGFGLPAKGQVDLAIYGADGRLVRTLFNGTKEAGAHMVQWDGRNDAGHKTPAGLYFIRLQTPQGDRNGKVLIVR